ncbi:hypothetical protein [Archangium sp.]|uniref:hypothetical protein n=1 Tax=Archangium sp. TaxID=1872627 RepID=UPI002D435E09|nr:hypothetical protein [Archangium sp.]HYO57935.1 hypothetical protein [Archangium sp.]
MRFMVFLLALLTCGAAQRVADKALDMAEAANATSSLSTAIDGESVNTLLVRTAEHLARLLELEQVGGIPRRGTTRWEKQQALVA